MPKKKYKKFNRKNFVSIPFSSFITLGTLADSTVILADLLGNALGEDLFIISIDCVWTIRGLTGSEVPIDFGFAHDDLSITEVLEALTAELTDPDDIIQKERARRPVRRAGAFNVGSVTNIAINDGNNVRTKMRFSVGDSHNISGWARNLSGATLTTGAIIQMNGVIYGRWQR